MCVDDLASLTSVKGIVRPGRARRWARAIPRAWNGKADGLANEAIETKKASQSIKTFELRKVLERNPEVLHLRAWFDGACKQQGRTGP